MSPNVQIECSKESWHFALSPTAGVPNLMCFKTFHKWTDNPGLDSKIFIWKQRQSLEKKSGQMTDVLILEHWPSKAFNIHSAPNWSFFISDMSWISNVWWKKKKKEHDSSVSLGITQPGLFMAWVVKPNKMNEGMSMTLWQAPQHSGDSTQKSSSEKSQQLDTFVGLFPVACPSAHHCRDWKTAEILTGRRRPQKCLQEAGWDPGSNTHSCESVKPRNIKEGNTLAKNVFVIEEKGRNRKPPASHLESGNHFCQLFHS